MIIKEPKYCLKDLAIVPSTITTIDSRSQCNPYCKDTFYPLFCAPMSCVTNEDTYKIWESNNIHAIMPRTIQYKKRIEYINEGYFVALSQKEFKKLFVDKYYSGGTTNFYRICIDTANAHRMSLYTLINKAKELAKEYNYELIIMVGNIANSETYKWICENSDVDYVRISIGTGKGCITSTQTSVHYPEASLIDECATYKRNKHTKTKIVCDGGIRNYSDIITALALGADYVMIGSVFAAMKESAALTTPSNKKVYYGMSTKVAQKEINDALEYPIENFVPKTSEGTVKHLDIIGNIADWMDNFDSYLRSAMSYTNCKNLESFTSGKVNLVIKAGETNNTINK